MDNLRVLVPSGVLGLGFDLDALKNGLRRNPILFVLMVVQQTAALTL